MATSELHGLSQRGGSVEVHIRFGKEIFSPLVRQGGADLIISLEVQESLRACYYASKERGTIFLINDASSYIGEAEKNFSRKRIIKTIQKFSQKIILTNASYICQKELGTSLVVGVYLVGWLVCRKILPLNLSSIILATRENIPEKFLELNLKAIELADKYDKI